MPHFHSWIVCESTGRWAAALRVALARRQTVSAGGVAAPRIQDVRSLADLEAGLKTYGDALGFVEVSNQNLAAVLELFAKNARRNSRFVALLEYDFGRRPGLEPCGRQFAADVLTEAGALCVVGSPRHIGSTIEVAKKYCAVRLQAAATIGGDSNADRAYAALPWQVV